MIDEGWARQNNLINATSGLSTTLSGRSDEIWIYDSNGNNVKNFLQLDGDLPVGFEERKDVEHTYKFDDHYIIDQKIGRLKINGVFYKYDVTVTELDPWTIKAEDPKAIFKDSISGEIKFIDKSGELK
ncbi:MAG: hypothetical protein OJF59_002502 [Cytophagales bacterium]|nr:hypothetical protein [Bacteroidota bacterium]MBS1980228.1 hypothetical protein [Bacteroidota bacterium]WHZ08748.1 MAG: hypothetical protein OJF59_002502 [Cytophagales bacterium]